MLTNFDSELFPDDCEVVEIPSHNQWVYLVQKNGSSSLRKTAKKKQYRIYRNQEIESLNSVDVYVRDPKSRYISGVNTFVQHLLRDNRNLDRDTCRWMATRYLFMNRHYLPQFHWVLNLSRFLSPLCQIRLHSFDDIKKIVDINDSAGVVPASDSEIKQILDESPNLDLWFFLDQILQDHIGLQKTWLELLIYYKQHPSGVYDILTSKFQSISKTLDALS
jgi:hypothetical protein